MNGKCLCGAVEFQLDEPLPSLYQCHCSLCRKLTGSSSDTAMFISRDQFRWVRGLDKISSYRTNTGYRSDFCNCCGCTVPHLMGKTSYFWVPAGLIDGELHSQVVAHLCVDSKAPWDLIGERGVRFAEMPSMEVLSRLLHESIEKIESNLV
ncbi:GFA family protein [Microbulbifer spongiae]|uniref:GFA family protein n=1 Tax=Microbulbifer spongiae TaxID=2944933 RepID=UPI003F557AA6